MFTLHALIVSHSSMSSLNVCYNSYGIVWSSLSCVTLLLSVRQTENGNGAFTNILVMWPVRCLAYPYKYIYTVYIYKMKTIKDN